jgi:hypothetical protein
MAQPPFSHLENGLPVSYKTKHTCKTFSAIALFGIYTTEFKICVHTRPMWVFIAALFTIIQTWKQPRCPATSE